MNEDIKEGYYPKVQVIKQPITPVKYLKQFRNPPQTPIPLTLSQ